MNAQTTRNSEKAGLASKWLGACRNPRSRSRTARTSSSQSHFLFANHQPHNTVTMENERGELVDLYATPTIP